jgi:hypothetical protein
MTNSVGTVHAPAFLPAKSRFYEPQDHNDRAWREFSTGRPFASAAQIAQKEHPEHRRPFLDLGPRSCFSEARCTGVFLARRFSRVPFSTPCFFNRKTLNRNVLLHKDLGVLHVLRSFAIYVKAFCRQNTASLGYSFSQIEGFSRLGRPKGRGRFFSE